MRSIHCCSRGYFVHYLVIVALALVMRGAWCSAATLTMTFDSIAEGTAFARNAVLEENGIRAVCNSDNASFSDPLNGFTNTPLYFHGTGHYIEFSLASSGTFGLVSFWLDSNGYANRWIQTSKNTNQVSLGMPTTPALKTFSGSDYTDITWFRIGTPWYATEVDSITVDAGVATSPPTFFSLQSPVDGEAIYITSPTLDWASAAGADTYELFLGGDDPPSSYGTFAGSNSQAAVTGLQEHTTYHWYVVASNQYGTTRAPESGSWSFATLENSVVLTSNVVINAGDGTIDGQNILVNGCTLTVNGSHSFGNLHLINGAKLTHNAATTDTVYRVDLAVGGTLSVSTNSAIDVSGKGYLPGRTLGNTTTNASIEYCGGSYGGLGGRGVDGIVNPVYGDFRNPNEPGSGAGTAGGGLIRIAAGALALDGVINANGLDGSKGQGSGGGIYLNVGVLSGSGQIKADGGGLSSSWGGGGGGRIAIYYDQLDGFDASNRISVAGGAGGADNQSAPGTLYLKKAGEMGQLVIDRKAGATGSAWLWLPEGTNYEEEVLLRGAGTTVEVWSANITPSNLYLMDGATLTHPAATATNESRLELNVPGMLNISSNSAIDVSGKGYVAGRTWPNTTVGASTNYSGGSYGGLGGRYGTDTVNAVYGDFRNPNELGSGAGTVKQGNQAGGGLVRIMAGTLVLDGGINASGLNGMYGRGSGGGILLDVGILSGAGHVTAQGGSSASYVPHGGGGGRIAIYYDQLDGFDVSNRISAAGGRGSDHDGAPGTVFLKKAGEAGQLAIDRKDGGAKAGWAWLPEGATNYLGEVVLRGAGTTVDVWSASIAPTNLYLMDGAVLTHRAATTNEEYRLELDVAGTLSVGSNSAIDVSGKGYLPGWTCPGTTNGASTGNAGGSYGGFGSRGTGTNNFIYGDFRNPVDPGSGGGKVNAGGGLVHITADSILLDGQIKANGAGSTYNGAGGSGGGVYVNARVLGGAGAIAANGGNGYAADSLGGGGGGRVAVYYDMSDEFDLTNQISVLGGSGGGGAGSPGTIYLRQTDAVGVLLVAGPDSALNRITTIWLPDGTNFTENILISGTNRVGELWSGEFAPVNLSILSGGKLTHPATTSNAEFRVELWVQSNLTVDGSSTIDVSGRGYLAGITVGNTNDGASTGYGGGSYGGLGYASSGTVNPTYGTPQNPDDPGSGGGRVNAGGGLVRITAETIQLDGQIKANGAGSTYYGAGGSGGGVYLDCHQLSGTGSVSVVGGDGYSYDSLGGGGGGRIAIYHEGATSFNLSTGLVVTGGGPSGHTGGAGTAYNTNQVAPAWIQKTIPAGNVAGTYAYMDVKVGNPLQPAMFTVDDVQITGPTGPVAIQSLTQQSQFVFRIALVASIEAEGTYALTFGTNIWTVLGGHPVGVSTQLLVLDHTAPAAPVVTNYPGTPATNWLRTTAITLMGTRETSTAVWRDTTRLVTNGTGTWSAALTLTQGLNVVPLHARDAAGNRSTTNHWLFLADTVAPAVMTVVPANSSYIKDPPTSVQLTFTEATSGLDLPRCAFSLKKSGVAVPGSWTATTNMLTFTPEGAVLDGTYAVAAKLIDNMANTGTFSSVFTVDTVAPPTPILGEVTTPTTVNQQTVTGTRETATSTYVYRGESLTLYGSQSGGGTNWSITVPLTNGWNHWGFTARDSAGNESPRTNVAIRYDNVAPGAVAVTGQVVGTGLQLTLGWSGYDEVANGNDIASYTIFHSITSFTNVSQGQALGTNGAGNKAFVVTGLTRNETKYYAVMARDTSGFADSNVTSVGLAPVDVVAPPNPTGAVFTCSGTDLAVRWSASADPYSDLAGYKVYVTNETEGATLPATTNEYLKTGLEESKAYSFRISAYDLTGNEGAGLVVTGYTLLPNPLGLTVTPYDGFMSLSWQGVTPASNVGFYAIYAETGEYARVTGLVRRLTATGTTAQVAGFVNGMTNWLAVTTVNRSGGENPEVTPAPAVTVDDIWGPEVLNLKWQGGSAAGPATWPGRFTVQARDPVGIGRVEFRLNGTALAGETSGTTNFSAFWDVSATTNDGTYELVVNAYDTKGNMTAVTQAVTVALAVPPAPAITSPQGTTVVSRTWQVVSGTSAQYAAEARLYVNGACAATSVPSASGSFSATLNLQEGTNRITVKAANRAGAGTASPPVSVVLDPSVPAAPVGMTASAQADGVIRLSWSDPLGVNVKGYHVYRASVPFTGPEQATRVDASLVAARVFSDLPSSDGTYYYRVSAVNLADTEGPLSAEAGATGDRVVPKVVSATYSTDGAWVPAENRFGRGTVTIDLVLSEGLQTTPFFSLNPVNGTPLSLALARISETVYRGSFAVTESSPCGVVYATFSGRDAAGNRGTEIQSGNLITLDACGPVLSELNMTPAAPIQNSEANPTTVTVVAVFAAEDVPVQQPTLKWSLSQTRTAETAVALSPLTERSWSGSIALPAGAGQPTEHLAFSYEGLDALGNTGRMIAAESRYEVYQGGLPPLEAPGGLAGRARPGGEVTLTWQAVSAAADYAVFRGLASNDVSFVARSSGATNYAETAEDATNWYAVASVREANGQASTGAVSAAVRIVADSTAPEAPTGLSLSLLGTGMKASWQAPGGETVTYAAYRSDSDFTSVTGLAAKATNIAAPTWTDPSTVTGPAYYGVVAEDAAGNRSPVSARAYTNLALLPVNSLQVRKTWGALPVVSWSHAQISGIAGYNLYAGAEGAGSLLNEELGSTATQHVDTSYAGGSRRYAIAAVDSQGGVETESVRRAIVLPDLALSLPTNTVILRGVMNRLNYVVANAGSTGVSGVKLYAGFQGLTHMSEPFDLEAGAQATVPVVVGGYTNLGTRVVVSNRVEIVPHMGELIELTSTNNLETGTGMLVAEVLNEELARGTDGKVRFAMHNTSSEEIEVVLAQGGNASPEVRVKLENGDGMVFASVAAKQTLGDKILTVANGQTVARIPAGESFTSADISLPIPTNAPDSVVLRLEIDRLHYHVGREDHVQVSGLQSARTVSLVETRYFAEATNVTPLSSYGDTNILIQGRAVNRASGQAEQNAPVKLVISVDGFERSYTVFSDSAGTWSYSFTPLAGESGTYRVWAVHPSVVAKPEQAGFVITRVGVSPAVVNLDIPCAYEYTIPVSITPSKGNPLTHVALSCTAADQPGGALPAGITVVATAQVASVLGGQSAVLPFRVQGDTSAGSTGQVSVRVSSEGAPAEGWGAVTVNYRLNEALPVLQWTPNYVQTGVAISNSELETVMLKNVGYAAMEGATLALLGTNGLAAPAWVKLNVPTNVGTLAVGEERAVTLAFAPTNGVSETQHEFRLRVRAQNHATKDINLFVGVDGSGLGGALFKVTDIYTGTSNQLGGIVQGLVGATITLQKESGTLVVTSRVSDVLGEAQFGDLPVGSYMVRVTASRHDTYGGRIWVQPGMVTTREVFLPYNLVTVEWSVVPVTIEDRYEVVLTATFETSVPAPVVVIEPTSVALPDMKAGDVFNVEMQIINHGLIRAENMIFTPPASDEYLRFELLTAVPATLEAKQVVTIPYRITCLKSLSGDSADAGGGGAAFCGTRCASAAYSFTCANGYRTSGQSAGGCVTRACSGSSPSYGPTGPVNFGLSGGGGGSSGSPGATSLPQGKLGCAPKCTSPCCPKEHVGSSAGLTDGGYQDAVVDLYVNTLGPMAEIRRVTGPIVPSTGPWSELRDRTWSFSWIDDRVTYNEYSAETADGGNASSTVGDSIPSTVALYSADASIRGVYTKASDGIFYADSGVALRVVRTGDGYLFSDGDENWISFSNVGRPLERGDRRGRTTRLVYDNSSSEAVGIADHFTNQVIWISRDPEGRIVSVRDSAVPGEGRTVSYQWTCRNPSGSCGGARLTNVVDVMGYSTAYAYDAENRLTSKRLPNGRTLHVTYRDDGGISSVLDDEGHGKHFDYSYDEATGEYYSYTRTAGGQITEKWFNQDFKETKRVFGGSLEFTRNPDAGTQDVEVPEPMVTRDEFGRIIRVNYPDGTVEFREYYGRGRQFSRLVNRFGVTNLYYRDAAGNETQLVEAAGTEYEKVTRYAYDPFGQMVEFTVVGHSPTPDRTTLFTYDDKGNVIQVVDSDGVVASNSYDRLGRLVQSVDAVGNARQYAYNAAGQVVQITTPMGWMVSNSYDEVGNLVKVIDVMGRETQYEYDTRGLQTKETGPFGAYRQYQYDADGRTTAITASDGRTVSFEYDAMGNVVRTVDAHGQANTSEYDGLGRLVKIVGPDGGWVRISYNGDNEQIRAVETPSKVQQFEYDVLGRLSKTQTITEHTNELLLTYGPGDQLIAASDGGGRTRRWEYNALGCVKATVDASGATNRFVYNENGDVLQMIDPLGRATHFERDEEGHLRNQTYPDGNTRSYSYDALGRLTNMVDAKGQRTRFTYDGGGRQVKTDYFPNTNDFSPAKTVQFYYDRYGRSTGYQDDITSGVILYDDSNRTVTVTIDFGVFQKSYCTTYAIDGRTVEFISPDGTTNSFRYDSLGQLSSIEVDREGVLGLADYCNGVPGQLMLPGGARQEFTMHPTRGLETNISFDASGQQVLRRSYQQDEDGLLQRLETEHGSYDYEYDSVQRLVHVGHPMIGSEDYTYDTVGNRLSASGTVGSWEYNSLNQLIECAGVSCGYDANGNLVSTMQGGGTNQYEWDVENRLTGVRGASGQPVALYAYDPYGNRLRKEVGGKVTWYLYGNSGLLAEYDETGQEIRSYGYAPKAAWGDGPLYLKQGGLYYYFVNDGAGAPQKLLTRSGAVAWSAWYEPFGRAHVDTSSVVTNPLRGSGQYWDEETGWHYNTFRYYAPEWGRYVSRDPMGEVDAAENLYLFAQNSPLLWTDPLGLEVVQVDFTKTSAGKEKAYRFKSRAPMLRNIPLIGQVVSRVNPYWMGSEYKGPPGEKNEMFISDNDRATLMAWNRDKPVFLFVPGYNDPPKNASISAAFYEVLLEQKLGQEIDVIAFTWPGTHPVFPWPKQWGQAINFEGSRDAAIDSMVGLLALLKCLDAAGLETVLLAHSLGNQIVMDLIRMGEMPELRAYVLAQAAYPQNKFEQLLNKLSSQVGQTGFTHGTRDTTVGYAFRASQLTPGLGATGVSPGTTLPSNVVDIYGQAKGHVDIFNDSVITFAAENWRRAQIDQRKKGKVGAPDFNNCPILKPPYSSLRGEQHP